MAFSPVAEAFFLARASTVAGAGGFPGRQFPIFPSRCAIGNMAKGLVGDAEWRRPGGVASGHSGARQGREPGISKLDCLPDTSRFRVRAMGPRFGADLLARPGMTAMT